MLFNNVFVNAKEAHLRDAWMAARSCSSSLAPAPPRAECCSRSEASMAAATSRSSLCPLRPLG